MESLDKYLDEDTKKSACKFIKDVKEGKYNRLKDSTDGNENVSFIGRGKQFETMTDWEKSIKDKEK